MKSSQSFTEKSFKKGMVIMFLIIIALLTIILKKDHNSDIYGLIIGLSILIAGVLGFIGSTQAIKGLKEKKTIKMLFAILLNFGIVILFIGLIIANIMDIMKVLK